MSTVRIYFFQNPPVELYQKIFITTYEPLRTTVLLLTFVNYARLGRPKCVVAVTYYID